MNNKYAVLYCDESGITKERLDEIARKVNEEEAMETDTENGKERLVQQTTNKVN